MTDTDMTDGHAASWIPDGHDMATVWTASTILARTLDDIRHGGTTLDGMMTTPDARTVRIDMTPDMAVTLATILRTTGRTVRYGRTSCDSCGSIVRWTTGDDTEDDGHHYGPWTEDDG